MSCAAFDSVVTAVLLAAEVLSAAESLPDFFPPQAAITRLKPMMMNVLVFRQRPMGVVLLEGILIPIFREIKPKIPEVLPIIGWLSSLVQGLLIGKKLWVVAVRIF